MKEYVFRVKSQESFFVSAMKDPDLLNNYTEEDIEKDASMILMLLLGVLHPKVGIRLQQLMIEAGNLGAELEDLNKRADTGDVTPGQVATYQQRFDQFRMRVENYANERVIGGPTNSGEEPEVEDFE